MSKLWLRLLVQAVGIACVQATTACEAASISSSALHRGSSSAATPPSSSRRASRWPAEPVEELVGVQRVVMKEQPSSLARRAKVSVWVKVADGPSRRGRGTRRRCTGSRGSADPRRGRGRSPRSTPDRARLGRAPSRLMVGNVGEGGLAVADPASRASGPRWVTASARIVAPPSSHWLAGVSRNETEQGSRTSTGESGAEM